MKSSVRIATCCAILATAMVRGLSADIPQSSYQLPSAAQVIGYLLQSVKWYRHVDTERQVVNDPGDLVFLNDNQALESQIVKLSFEFAKADAALAKTATSPHDAPATLAAPASADLAHFIELRNRNDQVTQQTSEDIGKLNEQIASARTAEAICSFSFPMSSLVCWVTWSFRFLNSIKCARSAEAGAASVAGASCGEVAVFANAASALANSNESLTIWLSRA